MATFKNSHSVPFDNNRLFEAFVAHSICSSISSEEVEPELLIYDGDDPGIDSTLIFVNERFVSTIDELIELFKGRKNDHDILIIFIQATTAEAWEKKKINSFESAILDFLSERPNLPMAEHLLEKKRMFDVIIENVGKVKGGKPGVQACYCSCNSRDLVPKEIEAARKNIGAQLTKSGLFSNVSSNFTGLGWGGKALYCFDGELRGKIYNNRISFISQKSGY